MIVRIWHGWTAMEQAGAFERLLRQEIFAGIENRSIKGYRGIQLLRRTFAGEVEFTTMTRFAVREFAGEDYEVAVVPEKSRTLLKRFDERSQHYLEVHSAGSI
jgi:hypothetical protein